MQRLAISNSKSKNLLEAFRFVFFKVEIGRGLKDYTFLFQETLLFIKLESLPIGEE